MTVRLRSATSDTFRSLRTRNFRLFFGGQLISQTGTWLTMITQTLLILKLTDSGIALGLLTAFLFGPMLVLGPWAGAVADRADKRTLLTAMQILAMFQSFALGVVVLAGWATVPVIYALAAVQGVITAFDNPARRAFVTEMVPAEDLANAVSLNSAVMTGSRVFGPSPRRGAGPRRGLRLAVHPRRSHVSRGHRRAAHDATPTSSTGPSAPPRARARSGRVCATSAPNPSSSCR